MAILSGGDIGFDEGGVVQGFSQALEALSKPFYTKTVKTFTYRKGLIASETTKDYSISATTVLVGALLGVGVAVGPQLVDALKKHWYLMALGPIGVLIIMSLIKSDRDGDGWPDIPQLPPEVLDVIKDAIDPFAWFHDDDVREAAARDMAKSSAWVILEDILDPFGFLSSEEVTTQPRGVGSRYVDNRLAEAGTSESPSAEKFILEHLE